MMTNYLNYTLINRIYTGTPHVGVIELKPASYNVQSMEIKVKCYSGHVYAEEPRSFTWQEKELGIKSVEKAWQEPGQRLFRVTTQDGKPFELCYNEAADRWSAVELIL